MIAIHFVGYKQLFYHTNLNIKKNQHILLLRMLTIGEKTNYLECTHFCFTKS